MPKYPVVQYQKITKNMNSAVLLAQIMFWMKNPKIVRKGKPWIANSAAEWCDQTGLTRDQYRRAISRLKKPPLGLIRTEQHLFGRKNITHVFLTERGKELLLGQQAELGIQGSPKKDQCAAPECGDIGQPESGNSAQLITEEINKEDHKETTVAFAEAHAIYASALEKEETPGKTNKNPGASTTGFMEAQSSSDDQGFKSVTGLAGVWKSSNELASGDFIPALTAREMKMLKQFSSRCPEGKAAMVIEVCIKHWNEFTTKAANEENAWSRPEKPTVEFLLRFAKSAINFTLNRAKAQSEIKHTKPKVATIDILIKPPLSVEDALPSKDELLSILND